MDPASLGLVLLGFALGCLYSSQAWQVYFPWECLRLIARSGGLRVARAGGPSPDVGLVLRTPRRVMPLDVDFMLHLNNVRYFDMLQQERIKLIFRTGFGSAVSRAGVHVALTDMLVRFRRELAPGSAYEIVTKVCGWSDTDSLYLQHSFCTFSRATYVPSKPFNSPLYWGSMYDPDYRRRS